MDLKYKVTDNKYTTAKEVLRAEFNVSARLYQKLKKNKQIYLNGNNNFYNDSLCLNDTLEVDLGFEEKSENILPKKMNLNILYEDKYMLIINKEPNVPVHPSMEHFEDSLSNGVKYYFDTINLHRKIRIVNRLDKDTSGIVIFAKCEYIQESLINQMKNNLFKKEYLGILNRYFKRKIWNN